MTAATGLTLKPFGCAPAQLLQGACREIARLHAESAPDLTHLTLVVPDLHAVPALAQTLQAAFASPVLLLPRMVTLHSWAREIALDQEVMSAAAQESMLYRLLGGRRWLEGTDLWAVAGELGMLFAELTRWQVALPEVERDFQAQLEAAYRAKAGASFGFEARVVHELWHASHGGLAIDPEGAYVRQLARLAAEVEGPVYVFRLERFAPAEEAFLSRCAERVAVTVFDADRSICVEPRARAIAAAWPDPPRVDLSARAQALHDAIPTSPLSGKLRFFGAAHAEQHAHAVDYSIRRWLVEGRSTIAVVVLDRVVARRARALLERSEILVRDEAGWALSTTSAATVVGRWLDAVASDHAYGDCLDLLKSPFVFHGQPRQGCQQAVWRLEQKIRRAGVVSGIDRYMRLAERDNDRELRQLLAKLAGAERAMGRSRRRTIGGWLRALNAGLVELGVHAGLAADAAGIELLGLLDALAAELEADSLRLSFGDWRSWLARKIESATFRDRSIDSPVIFTTLEATRLRSFDAVLLLGADASHLPGTERTSAFFNQSVRRELGLRVRNDEMREIEQRLAALMLSCDDVLVTWERTLDGEENLLSPLAERLQALHAQAWGDGLEDAALIEAIAASEADALMPPAFEPSARPAPRIPPSLLPDSISASGYNALMACPYQFYARYALRLAEADEVQEEIEKADYGDRVHRVLSEFHRAHPRVSALGRQEAMQLLTEQSTRCFQDLIDLDYQASGWLARWLALVPQYIDWQCAREAEGWKFVAAEVDRSITIETPAGRKLVLRGRIDRVDYHTGGHCAVVDYKTRARDPLRKALEVPGEDVQLPVYALLWGGEIAAALFLSIDRDGVVDVELSDVSALVERTRTRLAAMYDAMADGAVLPAQGVEEVCRYCEFAGLCRKKYWSD